MTDKDLKDIIEGFATGYLIATGLIAVLVAAALWGITH